MPGGQQPAPDSGESNRRLFGAIPDFLTVEDTEHVPPLTSRQKFAITWRGILDPGQVLFCATLAGISQAENADPSYHQGAAGYSKRLALAFADVTTENVLVTAVFASALHEDPRYYRLGRGPVLARGAYTISRMVVTRTDAGARQFNNAEIFGAAAAALLYNTYHPDSDRSVANTFESWGMQLGFDTGTLLVREFWPDVRRGLGKVRLR